MGPYSEGRPGIIDTKGDAGVSDLQSTVQGDDLDIDAGDSHIPKPCVTIEWFLDYQGPFDSEYFLRTHPQIVENYGDTVSYLFRHFPIHGNSQSAAEAAECAKNQKEFLSYHARLFERQEEWSAEEEPTDIFNRYAGDLGLRRRDFNRCVAEHETFERVNADFEEGYERMGEDPELNRGTPTFFVNGQSLQGAHSYEVFSRIIDEELKECGD